MNKAIIPVFVFLLFKLNAHATELEFSEHVVSAGLDEGPMSVFVADLDGDGDQDILVAVYDGGKIVWYENNPSPVLQFNRKVITDSAIGAISATAADLDGDHDLDIISASVYEPISPGGTIPPEGKVSWYENDGQFSPAFLFQPIEKRAKSVSNVLAADFNKDQACDVLSAWRDRIILLKKSTATQRIKNFAVDESNIRPRGDVWFRWPLYVHIPSGTP